MRYGVTILLLLVSISTAFAAETLEQGITAYEQHNLKEAARVFAAVTARRPGDVEALVWLGRTLIEDGLAEKAEAPLAVAIEIAPGNADAHFWMGSVYRDEIYQASFLKKGPLALKMKAEFERAVALDPESVRARAALLGYYLEAPSIAGGDVEKAKQQAMEIKKRDSLEGCSQLAMIYTHLEEWAQVEAIWNEAAKSHPDSAEPLVGLGLLYQNRKQWDRAFSAFEAAQKVDAANRMSLYQIGRTSVLSGKSTERGGAALARYVTMTPGPGEPSLAWAHYRLGQLYQMQSRNELARLEYQKALALNPQFREADEALRKLG